MNESQVRRLVALSTNFEKTVRPLPTGERLIARRRAEVSRHRRAQNNSDLLDHRIG